MIPCSFKIVIFDFDGVLVESNGIKDKAFELLFKRYPEHWEEIFEYTQSTAQIRFAKFKHIYTQILKQEYTKVIEERLADEFSAFTIKEVIRSSWVKGALELLEELYPKTPLYIVSVNPSEDLEQILAGRGMGHYFKGVYAVKASKTQALNAILLKERISQKEAVFIGDSREDAQAAHEAGIPFIGRISRYKFAQEGVPVFEDLIGVKKYLTKKG